MKIAIVGSGNVGGTLGSRRAQGGHIVVFSSRNPESAARICYSMRPLVFIAIAILLTACSATGQRGVADRRTEFQKFLPMTGDPARYGLKEVQPYFTRPNRAAILRAIERACQGGRAGSSIFDPAKKAGYYVNCDPENRQLLNGFVPLNPAVRPHNR